MTINEVIAKIKGSSAPKVNPWFYIAGPLGPLLAKGVEEAPQAIKTQVDALGAKAAAVGAGPVKAVAGFVDSQITKLLIIGALALIGVVIAKKVID